MISTAADCAAELARAQARTPLQWRKNAQPPQHEPPADLVAELGGDIIAGPAATAQRFALAAEAAGATYAEPLVIGLRSWQASLAIDDDVDILDTHTGAFLAPGRVVYPLATAGSSLRTPSASASVCWAPLQPACDGSCCTRRTSTGCSSSRWARPCSSRRALPGLTRPQATSGSEWDLLS